MQIISIFEGYKPQVKYIRMSNAELQAAWLEFVQTHIDKVDQIIQWDLHGVVCEMATRGISFYAD